MPATAVVATAVATAFCTNTACTGSYTHRDLCECTMCDGAGHGAQYRTEYARGAARASARTVGGFTRAMLDAIDDEPF